MITYNIIFWNILKGRKLVTATGNSLRGNEEAKETRKQGGQATLSLGKKAERKREGKNITESVGTLCFSWASNEDLPLLQLPVLRSHHHHRRYIGVKISRCRGKTRYLGSGRSRKDKATTLSPAGTNLGTRSRTDLNQISLIAIFAKINPPRAALQVFSSEEIKILKNS